MSLIALLALQAAAAAVPAEPDPMAGVRVTFTAGRVAPAQTAGLADIAADRRVTADDPVRVASISKLLVAIAVLRLVEAGTLDLDADVSERLGWRLRNPAFPDAPISLKLLLSHQSSLTDEISYVLPVDADMQAVLADPKVWDAEHRPGSYFRYTNWNFPVVAAVIERATGERFDRVMRRLVFDPLGIDACYNWSTCGDATVARAVVLYDGERRPVRDDHRGTRPICNGITPAADGTCDVSRWVAGRNGAIFSPQGGLRISANGLAKVGRLLLGGGTVDGVRLLSPASFETLTTPLWSYDGTNGETFEADSANGAPPAPPARFYCRYGLGVTFTATGIAGCGDDPFGDGRPRIGHGGNAYHLRSGLYVDLAAGDGVAFFVTGLPDRPVRGESAYTRVEERMARGR